MTFNCRLFGDYLESLCRDSEAFNLARMEVTHAICDNTNQSENIVGKDCWKTWEESHRKQELLDGKQHPLFPENPINFGRMQSLRGKAKGSSKSKRSSSLIKQEWVKVQGTEEDIETIFNRENVKLGKHCSLIGEKVWDTCSHKTEIGTKERATYYGTHVGSYDKDQIYIRCDRHVNCRSSNCEDARENENYTHQCTRKEGTLMKSTQWGVDHIDRKTFQGSNPGKRFSTYGTYREMSIEDAMLTKKINYVLQNLKDGTVLEKGRSLHRQDIRKSILSLGLPENYFARDFVHAPTDIWAKGKKGKQGSKVSFANAAMAMLFVWDALTLKNDEDRFKCKIYYIDNRHRVWLKAQIAGYSLGVYKQTQKNPGLFKEDHSGTSPEIEYSPDAKSFLMSRKGKSKNSEESKDVLLACCAIQGLSDEEYERQPDVSLVVRPVVKIIPRNLTRLLKKGSFSDTQDIKKQELDLKSKATETVKMISQVMSGMSTRSVSDQRMFPCHQCGQSTRIDESENDDGMNHFIYTCTNEKIQALRSKFSERLGKSKSLSELFTCASVEELDDILEFFTALGEIVAPDKEK